MSDSEIKYNVNFSIRAIHNFLSFMTLIKIYYITIAAYPPSHLKSLFNMSCVM